MVHELQLERINRRVVALSRVNHAILRTRDSKERLLAEACRIIHEELAYSFVWIGELLSGDEITSYACESLLDWAGQQTAGTEMMASVKQIARRSGVARHAIVESLPGGSHAGNGAGLTIAALSAPLNYSDVVNPVLVLVIALKAPLEMDGDELQTLQEVTGDLGLAVDAIAMEERSKRAEEALRTSEDRFRRLAEHSLVGIVLIQNDLYRYVNPAFARMFGYETTGDIIDRLGPLDLAAPESRDIVANNVARRVLGQVRALRYQYRGLRKDGTTFDVEEHGARTIHAQRLAVVATVIDVSAREASRRRLEALSRAGLMLARAQNAQQALERAVEQVVEILDCAAASIVLIERQELVVAAETNSSAVTESLAASIKAGATIRDLELIQQVFATRESVVADVAASDLDPEANVESPPHPSSPGGHRSRAAIPLMVRGEVIGCLIAETSAPGTLTDEDAQHLRLFADQVATTYQHLCLISRLEEERNRLRFMNHLSHALSETLMLQEVVERAVQQTSVALRADISLLYLRDATSGALTVVAADGLSANAVAKLNAQLRMRTREPWTALTAAQNSDSEAEVAALPPHWAFVEGLSPANSCTLNQPLEARGELLGVLSFSRRLPGTFGDADTALVSTLSVPIALAIQNAQLYEWIAHQAEIKSDALRRQEELDRMKDELIQNISHELRTPLALVMGYAEMLRDGQLGELVGQQVSAVDIIARRSRMLGSLVEDIALLWNLERKVERREILDLRETVQTALTEFSSHASERGLELRGTCPEHPVPILGVPVQVRRILDNLIGNSLKFTQSGGQIEVTLHTEETCAVLAVSDTGIGVPSDKLDRIFERFYQVDGSAKRRYGGTGLGLALVKAIVDAHNGTVSATSPVSADPERRGTTIVVRLPLDTTSSQE